MMSSRSGQHFKREIGALERERRRLAAAHCPEHLAADLVDAVTHWIDSVAPGNASASVSTCFGVTPASLVPASRRQADWTGDAGAANATIAARILGEILLMIFFGTVERRRDGDLGCDRRVTLGY